MKKMSFLTMSMFLAFSFLLVGCTEYKHKKINDVINIKYEDITKIVFSDGARGNKNKPYTLEDKEKINEFMKYIDGYVIKKEKNHETADGWIHHAQFFIKEEKVMDITFTDPLEINETYYNIIDGNLSPEDIDKFIKSINPHWDTNPVWK